MKFIIAAFLCFFVGSAYSASANFSEPAGNIRYQQYIPNSPVLWRMPYPGASVFPGGSCTVLSIPGGDAPNNRFLSIYLYLKANGGNYFLFYETTNCTVTSFGIDG